jgi:hypothetical protein
MNVRPLARVCGLLGGASWLARAVLGDGSLGEALQWIGLVLLFVGLFGLGTLFVSKGAVWLQVIVGVAFPLLVWSVVEVVNRAGDPVIINAVVGVLVAVACVTTLGSGGGGDEKPPRRHAGAHAR